MIETASISNDSTSSIQTLLSALESHQFMPYGSLAGFTAGGEFRPALKHYLVLQNLL